MKFLEVHQLENRGAVDPAQPSEVEGTLLIGEEPVLEYACHHSSYGEDFREVYPAFSQGERAWLVRDTWSPAFGYSASGTQESILSFEEGVRLFLERGVFAFPQPA